MVILWFIVRPRGSLGCLGKSLKTWIDDHPTLGAHMLPKCVFHPFKQRSQQDFYGEAKILKPSTRTYHNLPEIVKTSWIPWSICCSQHHNGDPTSWLYNKSHAGLMTIPHYLPWLSTRIYHYCIPLHYHEYHEYIIKTYEF